MTDNQTPAATPEPTPVPGTLLAGTNPPEPPDTGAPAQDTKQDDVQTGEKPDAKPAGAPEKYEFQAPEGTALDPELVESFSAEAKALNLTQEQAQKLVDLYGAQATRQAAAQHKAWTDTVTGWAQAVKADPEIGGTSMSATVSAARAALDRFGTPELKDALESLGIGNHPELVRVFAKVGKAMSEDKIHAGAPPSAPKDAAEILYGNK